MPDTIVQLETPNTKGRDIIAGDIHGCVDLLMQELERANFDPSVDRLYCLGDLVDRGPKSLQTLCLLKHPWFKSLRSNHENMLLATFGMLESHYYDAHTFIINGGHWVLDLPAEEREVLLELLPLVRALPYVRSFVDEGGSIMCNLVHAELMRDAGPYDDLVDGQDMPFYTDQDLLEMSKGNLQQFLGEDDLAYDRFTSSLTWGRRTVREWKRGMATRLYNGNGLHVVQTAGGVDDLLVGSTPYAPGLSPTFVGHTPVARLGFHHSHYFMDRGAYQSLNPNSSSSRLTLIDREQTLQWLQKRYPREKYLDEAPAPSDQNSAALTRVSKAVHGVRG